MDAANDATVKSGDHDDDARTPDASPVRPDVRPSPARRSSGLLDKMRHRRSSSNVSLSPGSSESPLGASVGSLTPLFGRKPRDAPSEPEDSSLVLKQGPLMYVERRKVKTQTFALSLHSLSTVEGSLRQWLREVSALVLEPHESLPHSFSLVNRAQKPTFLGCEEELQQREWVLLMHSASITFCDSMGILSHSLRIKLLQEQYHARFTGGTAKREEISEEWQYRRSGAVLLQGDKATCAYQWDGVTLAHSKGPCYGRGEWDGLVLAWYPVKGMAVGFDKKAKKRKPKGGGKKSAASPSPARKSSASSASPVVDVDDVASIEYEDNPSMRFLWCPADNSYRWLSDSTVVCSEDPRNWKWSRHFLTKMRGIGHWISEGSVPEPLIILLQMMRYQRKGFNLAAAAADV